MDGETTVDGSGITSDQVEGRHVAGAFQPGDNGLGGAHAGCDLGLGQTSGQAGVDHFVDDGKDWPEPVILGFDLRIGQQLLTELGKAGRGLIS